jgi:hypothetical protein
VLFALWLPLAIIFEAPAAAVAVAGGAVAVPIIIHLLNRRRFRIAPWAAMRFLLAAQKKNSRRMRLEQLLLLLVRCALVLLLITAMLCVTPWAEAMWRWMFPNAITTTVGGGQRTHKILVLDGSFSMALKEGDGNCFDRAKTLAAQMVRESTPGDAFSVVMMAAPARTIIGEPSEDRGRVAEVIEKLRLPHGNADLLATLNTVDGLLQSSSGKYPGKEVYFLTDMQQSTWIARQPPLAAATLQKIHTRGRAILVNVSGEVPATNLAITSLNIQEDLVTRGRPVTITARVFNHGTQALDKVSLRFEVGKARAKQGEKELDPHVIQTLELEHVERGESSHSITYTFTEPGEWVLHVQAQEDALPLDDHRYAVVSVRDHVNVLIVNGRSDGDPFDTQSGKWLELALNPEDENSKLSPARVKVINTADLVKADLSSYDCVFLCDVPEVFPDVAQRLTDVVRLGGGVVFFLGPQVNREKYNQELFKGGKGLLPVPLDRLENATEGYDFQLSGEEKAFNEAPLREFSRETYKNTLFAARFRTFFQVGEPASGTKPRRVLLFAPIKQSGRDRVGRVDKAPAGGAAVLEWNPPVGDELQAARKKSDAASIPPDRLRGRVVLVTTTANTAWNSWPASPSYPAFVQELLTFAASGRLRERSVEVAEPLELFLPNKLDGAEAKVMTPDGRTETTSSMTLGNSALVRWTDTDVSGIYKVLVGSDPQEYVFAVNVPSINDAQTSESSLNRVGREELQTLYNTPDLQVVRDLRDVDHSIGPNAVAKTEYQPLGGDIAHWILLIVLALVLIEVVLAWVFGHYSAAVTPDELAPKPLTGWEVALYVVPWVLFALVVCIGGVLIHYAITNDFLGFLPNSVRRTLEWWMNIPAPEKGESNRWRLEYTPYFLDARSDPWIAGTIAAGAIALVYLIYRKEGRRVGAGHRILLGSLRLGLLALLLVLVLPQTKLFFERQAWPDVVILIDDSESMSAVDKYSDARVQEAAEKLAQVGTFTQLERLKIAKALLTRSENDWLTALVQMKQVRLHVYHCSTRAARISDVNTIDDVAAARTTIQSLEATDTNDSSQLGTAVRQVINDFRGSSLAAVVMLTDGVTTEGEDLPRVAKYAAQMGVPLFFVGIGDAHDVRDIYLQNLQVDDNVYVRDKLIFELDLVGKGYKNLTVPVTLREKGKAEVLDKQMVVLDASGKPVKVTLKHTPETAGDKQYVIDTPVQDDEVDKDNNHLERAVRVNESKLIKVLYVEGYPRFEFRFLKTLLERESNRTKGNKSIDLRVLLLDADDNYQLQDRCAIGRPSEEELKKDPRQPFGPYAFPTRRELFTFDVVILGDVDPLTFQGSKRITKQNFTDLADFVREQGKGLLMIAGERFAPLAYRDTELAKVLPVDVIADRPQDDEDAPRTDGFRPELTPAGRMHPIFRFTPSDKENDEIWSHLREMYWWSEGYVPKRAAEVLAVHPRVKSQDKKGQHALVLQQFVGSGRCMFFGFNETWRWGFREDQLRFNQFWIQTVRYLSRTRSGRIEVRLDQQTHYRRGQPIKATVRFPDDGQAQKEDGSVKLTVERRNPSRPPQTIKLAHVPGSRGRAFEGTLTQTPEGEYRFWLSEPVVADPKPSASCKVLAPPGEMYGLRLDQPALEAAAETSGGRYYNLADADRLVDDLPHGTRITVNAPGPPWLVWNHVVLFLLLLTFLTTEWLLRKRKNLL